MNETPSQTVGPFFSIGMAPRDVPGGSEALRGRVIDGAGDPVPDAVVEAWQPEGWGRSHTDEDGGWEIRVAPAREVVLSVFARGLLNRVVTRVDGGAGGGAHDIHLQGERESPFYAV
jgi:protocatechuate 3,4-dioxygenase, alpha subunit